MYVLGKTWDCNWGEKKEKIRRSHYLENGDQEARETDQNLAPPALLLQMHIDRAMEPCKEETRADKAA